MRGGQRSVVLLVGLVAVAIVLSVLHNTGAGVPLEGFFAQLATPIRGAFNALAAGVSGTLDDFQRFGELRDENEELRAQVAELEARVAQLRNAERENLLLREALGFTGEHPEYEVVTARVVGRDSLAVLDTIIIDRGASSGIRVGMAVVANGSLAGRVTGVTDSSAELLPVHSPSSSVNVATQGEATAADGIADGDGSGGLVMRHIEPAEPVSVGDFVVTSGLGGGFPRGIPVGRILSVEQSTASVFHQATIEPFVRTDRLDIVQIIVGQRTAA